MTIKWQFQYGTNNNFLSRMTKLMIVFLPSHVFALLNRNSNHNIILLYHIIVNLQSTFLDNVRNECFCSNCKLVLFSNNEPSTILSYHQQTFPSTLLLILFLWQIQSPLLSTSSYTTPPLPKTTTTTHLQTNHQTCW